MTLNGGMAVTLRYFTDLGKAVCEHITASICACGIYAQSSVFCSACRCRKESFRSLSQLVMSFLFVNVANNGAFARIM